MMSRCRRYLHKGPKRYRVREYVRRESDVFDFGSTLASLARLKIGCPEMRSCYIHLLPLAADWHCSCSCADGPRSPQTARPRSRPRTRPRHSARSHTGNPERSRCPTPFLTPQPGILFPSIIARSMVAVDRPGIFPQQIGLHASSHFLGGGYC